MELFTKDELIALKSMSLYWKEILARDEPGRSEAINREAYSVANKIGNTKFLQLLQFYLDHHKEPNNQ